MKYDTQINTTNNLDIMNMSEKNFTGYLIKRIRVMVGDRDVVLLTLDMIRRTSLSGIPGQTVKWKMSLNDNSAA